MAEREELRRVERFEELRAGMLVVIKACGNGCGDHRGILTTFEKGAACRATNGSYTTEDVWNISPPGKCGGSAFGRYDVNPLRCVYIVDTGNDDEAEREEGRRLEKVISVHAKVSR